MQILFLGNVAAQGRIETGKVAFIDLDNRGKPIGNAERADSFVLLCLEQSCLRLRIEKPEDKRFYHVLFARFFRYGKIEHVITCPDFLFLGNPAETEVCTVFIGNGEKITYAGKGEENTVIIDEFIIRVVHVLVDEGFHSLPATVCLFDPCFDKLYRRGEILLVPD